MAFNFIVERHKGLVLDAKREWERIGSESFPPLWHFKNFALPWAGIALVLTVVFNPNSLPLFEIFTKGFVGVCIVLLAIVAGAYTLEKLSDNFSPTTKEKFIVLLTYASIPMFIGQIMAELSFISFASLWFLWSGFEVFVRPNENKKVGFFVLSVLILIIIQVISTAILGKLTGLL